MGAPAVVALHGFAQTAGCLGPIAAELAHAHRVVMPDMPGHGEAAGFAHLDVKGAADALVAACGTGTWLGYSMGARVALHAALEHPGRVQALVLVSATAGIDDAEERAGRAEVDHARAQRLEELGVEDFVDEWLGMDMFAELPGWARFERERATNTVSGLAGSLRNAGTGSMDPLWHRVAEIDIPVLCLAGARDPAFVAHAQRLAGAIGPSATAHIVTDAGHAVHLEQPDHTAEVMLTFLGNL